MESQSQCSCRGGNPDCYKCGGWGYIDGVSANRITAGPVGDAGKQSLAKRLEELKSKLRPVTKRRSVKVSSGIRTSVHTAARDSEVKSKVAGSSKQAGKPGPSVSGIVRCTCGAWVAKGLYDGHSCVIKKPSKGKGRRVRISAHERHQDSRVEDARQTRALDATVGYSGSFRQNGIFGSHPSHDDHGDESSA